MTTSHSAIDAIDAVIKQTLQRGGDPGYGTLMQLRAVFEDATACLQAAAARVEIANAEGHEILSAWLPEAHAILARMQQLA